MSGAGGTMQAVTSLLLAVGIELPPWGMPAIALAIMILLLPFLLYFPQSSSAHLILFRLSPPPTQLRPLPGELPSSASLSAPSLPR